MLPVWLSPIEVRILPIADKHFEYANELADKLSENNIRVDIDNTEDRVGKKIRNAAKEWVPYVFVIGDKELENNKFQVTVRETGEKVDMTIDELIDEIHEKTKGMPYRRLPIPRNTANRIHF